MGYLPGNHIEKRDTSWIPKAKEMLEAGETYAATALAVDRDRRTVATHLPGYGIRSQHWKWKPRALELLKEGVGYREVARTIGVDHNHIRKSFPGYGLSPAEAAQVRQANQILNAL